MPSIGPKSYSSSVNRLCLLVVPALSLLSLSAGAAGETGGRAFRSSARSPLRPRASTARPRSSGGRRLASHPIGEHYSQVPAAGKVGHFVADGMALVSALFPPWFVAATSSWYSARAFSLAPPEAPVLLWLLFRLVPVPV